MLKSLQLRVLKTFFCTSVNFGRWGGRVRNAYPTPQVGSPDVFPARVCPGGLLVFEAGATPEPTWTWRSPDPKPIWVWQRSKCKIHMGLKKRKLGGWGGRVTAFVLKSCGKKNSCCYPTPPPHQYHFFLPQPMVASERPIFATQVTFPPTKNHVLKRLGSAPGSARGRQEAQKECLP